MTIEATAWAFSTGDASTPLERLALIIMADSTDGEGVCAITSDFIAEKACASIEDVQATIDGLRTRGVLKKVRPTNGAADPDFSAFDVFFLPGIDLWRPMPRAHHPDLGWVYTHDLYGMVVME